LLLLVASCVDLSRPSVLLERDAPVFDTRDATGGTGGGAGRDGSPGDVPVIMDADDPDQQAPDLGEPIDTVGLDLLIIDPPDMAPPDLPLVTAGKPCDQGEQCASGVCSGGVCCDRACNLSCYSCTLNGKLGTCSAVPAGEDPGNSCSAEVPATCGRDGTCDGSGGCRRYPANTQCAEGRCSNATEFAASTCDGAGTCRVGASKSCAPGICMGASCASSCSQNDQCQTGFFCDNSKCTVKRPNGMTCGMPFQCASNFCVDGYCCDSQCGEMCKACSVPGALGICTVVPVGTDPRSQCVAEAASTCGRAGGCNGAGACRLHPMGTTCAASSCANTFTETTARTCNGLGVCQPAGSRTCAPYFCSGSGCPTSCTDSAQCQPGFQCTGNTCVRIPGLALYWRFEESMGTTAFDSSGNNFNGTYIGVTGTPTPSMMLPPAVMYPNAFSRDFVRSGRQAVRLAPMPAALRPTNNLTLSVWYRSTSVDTMGGELRGGELISGGDNYLLRLRIPDATPPPRLDASRRISSGSDQISFTDASVLNGSWHHVAVVYATDGIRLYVDGQLRGTPSTNGSNLVYNRGPDFFVGRHGFNEEHWDFEGNIDEVRIYTRVLSAAEITALAQGRNAP
jgi:Concanavalin A-like lectin/glucanases superfamily